MRGILILGLIAGLVELGASTPGYTQAAPTKSMLKQFPNGAFIQIVNERAYREEIHRSAPTPRESLIFNTANLDVRVIYRVGEGKPNTAFQFPFSDIDTTDSGNLIIAVDDLRKAGIDQLPVWTAKYSEEDVRTFSDLLRESDGKQLTVTYMIDRNESRRTPPECTWDTEKLAVDCKVAYRSKAHIQLLGLNTDVASSEEELAELNEYIDGYSFTRQASRSPMYLNELKSIKNYLDKPSFNIEVLKKQLEWDRRSRPSNE